MQQTKNAYLRKKSLCICVGQEIKSYFCKQKMRIYAKKVNKYGNQA